MPIVAICPYCRAGGVRAPDAAVGSSATCPTCRSSFTVVPSDQPVTVAPKPAPPPPAAMHSARPDAPPARPPTAETREHSSPIDRTEPSPVLPPEPARRAAVDEPAEPMDAGYALALAGASLFGVGMTAAQLLPYGRAVGLFACVLGGVAGVLSLGAEGRARLVGAAGAGLNGVAVLLLLFSPLWLGLPAWDADDAAEPEPTGPAAVAHKTGVVMPVGEWVKAEQAAWKAHDIRLTVRSWGVGPADLVGPDGAKRRTQQPVLLLVVQVANAGVQKRAELSGWLTGAADQVGLTDPSGKRLRPKAFDPGWGPAHGPLPAGAGLGPGSEVTVAFAFEPPAARAEYLRLELPMAAAGLAETATFRLPGPFGPPAKRKP